MDRAVIIDNEDASRSAPLLGRSNGQLNRAPEWFGA